MDEANSYTVCLNIVIREVDRLKSGRVSTFNYICDSNGREFFLTSEGISNLHYMAIKIFDDFDLRGHVDKEGFKSHVTNIFADLYWENCFGDVGWDNALMLISSSLEPIK